MRPLYVFMAYATAIFATRTTLVGWHYRASLWAVTCVFCLINYAREADR